MGLLFSIIERHAKSDSVHATLDYPPQENALEEIISYSKFKYESDAKKNFDIFRIVLSQAIVDIKFTKRIREAIPLFQEPELLTRLESLRSRGKIPAHVNLEEMVKNLMIYLLGNIIAQRILLDTPHAEAVAGFEIAFRKQNIFFAP